MSDKILLKINCSKIDKEHLFDGKKGKYLDAILIPTPDDQYGNDFVICQSVAKAQRGAGVKGPIIGNAKYVASQGTARQGLQSAKKAADAPASEPPTETDDVPF